ncbi:transporter, partial [Polaribacter sp.]|nr:transporter [Polaribacter sp.]
STFFENQGIFKKEQKDTNIGTGIAFLLTTNLQVNTSARGMFEGNSTGYYTSLGVSYRIDRHQDSYIELDDNGNPIEDSPEDKLKKKNFFGRIFSIFKKKDPAEKGTEKETTKKKKKRRGFFGLFKKKKETALEKIEREIKELEKKIKKDGNLPSNIMK